MSVYKWVTNPADPEGPFYCTGPLKGERVLCSKDGPDGERVRAEGTVATHWHYDACIFEVRLDDGSRATFHDQFRETVLRIGPVPAWVDEVEMIAAGKGSHAS